MGTGEESTPAKPSKPTASAQETPTTPSYPDWSSSMQAYYGAGATPFFATPVASPTPHPYLWGNQHALIPPYGTPVPYPALYPPGAVYAHPNMATAPSMGQRNVELEGKAPDGKDRVSNKKFKGTLGNTGVIGGKGGESRKAASGSGNDGVTRSAESGSEGSSDASDDDNNQVEYAATANKKGSFDQMLAEGANAQNNTTGVPGNSVVPIASTNLNIAMDLWTASPAGTGAVKMRPNPPGGSPAVAPATMVGREGMIIDQWIQDERELKRQKRKQSNRESARRSRLRKQAECEDLQARVETLTNENSTLRDELRRVSEECEKLTSENDSIKEELTRLCGPNAVSEFENCNGNQLLQFRGDEGNR